MVPALIPGVIDGMPSGNYVPSLIPGRYDAFLFLDRTQALHPLPTAPQPNVPPDLYPWGE